ncbi:MAG: hypothetical protein BAJATHORv1_50094 [Candidatus Thorarchaeota archaeon]|nr:MAG: hypothetical protein BAJATHORv1_50094 [Candidatus Thorarchaeota archaeon]
MINSYSDPDILKRILGVAKSIRNRSLPEILRNRQNIKNVHSLLYNPAPYELQLAQSVCSLLSIGLGEFGLPTLFTPSADEIIMEFNLVARACDLLLSSFYDQSKLGNGRSITLKFAERTSTPLISLGDEIHSFQSALGYLFPIFQRLGELQNRDIVISWAFDNRFSLPSVPQSLLLLGSILGSNVQVRAPHDFPLLRRVVRDSKEVAKESGGSVEIIHTPPDDIQQADVVFAFNWCSLNEFIRPERNAELAKSYRDWHISQEALGRALFMTEPPVRTGIIADRSIIDSPSNLTPNWLESRIHILLASIATLFDSDFSINALV